MTDPQIPPGRRRRRRSGRTVALAAGAVVALGAAVAAATGFGGTPQRPAATGALPPATAPVTRQTLLDTQTADGELGYGTTSTLVGRLRGTVTRLPEAGAVLRRGQAVYRLDDTPVVLLYGTVPAYRPLRPGTEGADVRQLEQNLRALGYTGFTVDDTYNAATASAVRRWQEKLGLPETGVVELGRVVFAPGEIRVDSLSAEVGEPAGQAVLAYTGTTRVVVVQLDVADERLARKGAAVTVELPGGATVAGKISRSYTVIEAGDGTPGSSAETRIEMVVAPTDQKALGTLTQAAVDVVFTASQRENVLTVPVAALVALREGGYGVEVVEGSASRYVAVEAGLFSDGRVEVSGDGLREGMSVGIPR
ncbi:peptidoglycan-binding domain-containing protein [Catellatospora sp. KI3]|uniref:peptidoglycan-binding domain-containing protein n=1 Tax=Catellatospora sp. KI3 TaxID=3041620 RepID=UPI0024831047|nr:peptidoglycan-binding domain-containing protein [Catellatospora sp. KI3]MDI1464197.1 peptidoglycan-binding domain-containing protein [Catellatospora sp. KI3]